MGRALALPRSSGRPLRVLLSEGYSTSAREALTLLAGAGHAVEICDPDAHCLARFSRLHADFHRSPGLRDQPAAYLAFVEDLLSRRRFDVLLPIHEQGLLFARVAPRLLKLAGLALPSFASYRAAHSKTGFALLLDELGLAQPPTRRLRSGADPPAGLRFPCVLKSAIGTASRGTFVLRSTADLDAAWPQLRKVDEFGKNDVLLQEFVAGAVERAQAVFWCGELLGFHACAQVVAGAGGGDAVKESVTRPQVRADVARLGARLAWHGALSVDYIWPGDGVAVYIDCNPRLVEPMNAALSGADLIGLLLAVSMGERPAPAAEGRAGTRTRLALQVLLGAALHQRRRRAVIAEAWALAAGHGAFRDSIEELSPVRLDWPSALPLVGMVLCLVADPRLAARLARKGWGAHLLSPRTIAMIEGMPE
jgi:predicted ATP-grasp superfamily ATP-dependent carboligase